MALQDIRYMNSSNFNYHRYKIWAISSNYDEHQDTFLYVIPSKDVMSYFEKYLLDLI